MKEFRDTRYLVAAQGIALQPSLVAFLTPLYFGALTRERGFSATELAGVTTAEVAGTVTVALTLALFASRVNFRHLSVFGAVLLSGALAACMFAASVPQLLALRVAVGMGYAMLASATTIYLAATSLPVRWYGWQMTITTLLIMTGLALMPFVEQRWGLAGFYAALLVLAPVTLWSALVLPAFPQRDRLQARAANSATASSGLAAEAATSSAHPAAPEPRAVGRPGWWNPAAILGVLAVLAYAGYVYPTYNFSERLGELAGVTPLAVALVLSVTTPIGLVGSLFASTFPERFGAVRPIVFAATLVLGASAALALAPSSTSFWAAMIVLSFVWNFAQPYLFGIIARADTDGRFLFLQSPAQELAKAGAMLVLSGALDAHDLGVPAATGAALMCASAAFAYAAVRLLRARPVSVPDAAAPRVAPAPP